jgi:hypothetical protein
LATAKKSAATGKRTPTAAKKGSNAKANPASSKRVSRKAASARLGSGKAGVIKLHQPEIALKKGPATAAAKNASSNRQSTVLRDNADKAPKPKKLKLVRDSFTIPKLEYMVLDQLKLRAAELTRPAKKSELLRAGIKALAALSDAAFLTALEQVPAIKTGRPALNKRED